MLRSASGFARLEPVSARMQVQGTGKTPDVEGSQEAKHGEGGRDGRAGNALRERLRKTGEEPVASLKSRELGPWDGREHVTHDRKPLTGGAEKSTSLGGYRVFATRRRQTNVAGDVELWVKPSARISRLMAASSCSSRRSR